MKSKVSTIIEVLFIVVWSTGCFVSEPPSEEWRRAEESNAHEEWAYTNKMAWPAMDGPVETVMTPGMRITARNSQGRLTVMAGEGYERSYTWDGATRSAKLSPRKTRWHGSLGIYTSNGQSRWKSNGGITRGVLEEGVLWFNTADDAFAWIKANQSSRYCVYSDDGLMAVWKKVPARKQLNVNVWQIYVAGQKPTRLEGSDNNGIMVDRTQ